MVEYNDILGKTVVGYRYGIAPECGRSYNYRENHYEDGVSMAQVCYCRPINSFAANGEKKYYYKGIISGIGSDNEICISDIKRITYKDYCNMRKDLIAESNLITNYYADQKLRLISKGFDIKMTEDEIEKMRNNHLK